MKTLDFRLVSISEAARFYSVSVPTMRRWDKTGRLTSTIRTPGNHRRYHLGHNDKLKIGYARVSSHDQRNDLVTQAKSLYGAL
ncbi:recombinase family protein [Psychromonas sp.]|uniref:recombinase family protein n=1 Tax=Psychromonas sp. TaxID=1884585 RepID=UPI003568AA8B